MEYFEDKDRAVALARAAMDLMDELGVVPNPRNYALWYAYVTKQHPDLTHAVDTMLAESREVTPERGEDLYRLFFGAEEAGEAIRDTGQKIEGALAQIIELVNETHEETVHYGQVLEDFSGKISGTPRVEDLRGMLAGVLDETRKIEEHSRKVETRLLASSQEVTALRQNLEVVRQESLTDGLTGIANRKSFDKSLRDAADEAVEEGEELCLLLADIDHFKKFNDNYGHQLGDQVLKLVAKTLVECIKGRDIAARYGGEEFVIILPQTKLEHAVKLAQHICLTLATKKVVRRKSGEDLGTVTVSVGVSQYQPGEPLDNLVMRADDALYTAKAAGRNRVTSEREVPEKKLEKSA